jgi:hypothetical protein
VAFHFSPAHAAWHWRNFAKAPPGRAAWCIRCWPHAFDVQDPQSVKILFCTFCGDNGLAPPGGRVLASLPKAGGGEAFPRVRSAKTFFCSQPFDSRPVSPLTSPPLICRLSNDPQAMRNGLVPVPRRPSAAMRSKRFAKNAPQTSTQTGRY